VQIWDEKIAPAAVLAAKPKKAEVVLLKFFGDNSFHWYVQPNKLIPFDTPQVVQSCRQRVSSAFYFD